MTGVSTKGPTSAKATMSSNLRTISARFIPRMAALRNTFSRPVSSEWKPVPTSRRLATRPRTSTRPSVGRVMRESTFKSVLLPAPLRPMTPTTSPASTAKLTSRSAQMDGAMGALRGRRRAPRARSTIASRKVR